MKESEMIVAISRYLEGEATDIEKKLIVKWLEQSDENRRFFAGFAANEAIHRTITSEELARRTDNMSNRLQSRISDESQRTRTRQSGIRLLSYVLAAAAASLVIGIVFFFAPSREESVAFTTISNPGNETQPYMLEDGTQVWLRPSSSISYNVSGQPDMRTIKLDGQAYFDVARDEGRPLTVMTPTIRVRVLGTAFAVNCSSNNSDVVLERGSVRILSGNGDGLVTLIPGQKATFRSSTGDVTVETVYAEAYITQHYNLISMTDVTIREILARLEKRYGVGLRCNAANPEKKYTMNYLKTDTLEDVLSIVEYLAGARCEIIDQSNN